ncbi:molybdopterin-binding protein [Methanoregula sp.]|uniref:molybdopterin-binding protein n=1 Tax=Methanoregula sp. TaxID=2052170 RepID=UPI003BB09AEF
MVKRYLSLCSLENALHLLKTSFPAPDRRETIPVDRSLGRVVAAPVYAPYTVPEVSLAAMDGIAVRSRDTLGAGDQTALTIRDFARVNTGNPIPPGYDAVIMIEDTVPDSDGFRIRKSAAPGQHIRPAGEDIQKGRLILPRGHMIRAFDIGALATYGIACIEVRTIHVGIIPTGSELVPLGVQPGPGQIVESNTIMAQVYLDAMGAHCTRLPITCDDKNQIRDALHSATASNDLVLISAGSSAGTRDYTAEVISSLGKLLFHGVAVKPGKPMMLGEVGDKPVIGLPGYPLAAQTIIREFAGTLLEEWGLAPAQKFQIPVRLATPVSSDLGFDEFLPVSVGRVGRQYWGMAQSRGPVVQMATVRANGYAHIPAPVEGFEAGHKLDVFLTTDPATIYRTILLSGVMDPALEELGNLARDEGLYIHAGNTGNTGGLLSLKRNSCHAAPMMIPETSHPSAPGFVQSLQGMRNLAFIHIAGIEQGIASKEPVSLDALDKLRWVTVRRDLFSPTLFDTLRSSHNPGQERISGITGEVGSSAAVAAAIQDGHADAGICSRQAAEARELCFVRVADDQYELALHCHMLDDPLIAHILTLVRGQEFKEALMRRGTYNTSQTGRIRRISAEPADTDSMQVGSPSGLI